jgi:hypothetical protein
MVLTLADRLAAVVAELATAPVADLIEPDASRVHAAIRRARDALAVVEAAVVARVEADGRWATTATGRGARDFEDWLSATTRTSRGAARRGLRLARAVQDESVPGLADAVTAGSVSLEHADVLTRLGPTTPARRAVLADPSSPESAAGLLVKAGRVGVEEFARHVRRWAARIDPAADEHGHRKSEEKVSATWTDQDDVRRLTAILTPEGAATVDAALTAVAGVPAATDRRTTPQRRGGALVEMARLVLDHGLAAGSSGGFRPHLTVTVPWDTLSTLLTALDVGTVTPPGVTAVGPNGQCQSDEATSGTPAIPSGYEPAVLADGAPIPASVLARLACDAEVSRVVFGPASQVLDVGRDQRLYTGAMRRAVVARDRHCAFPGCDRAPRYGEVHHARHWAAHGGRTSVDNGVLLCWHHHAVVHSRQLTIHRNNVDGRWEFYERDGTHLSHPVRPSSEGSRRTPASPPGGPPARAASPPRGTGS